MTARTTVAPAGDVISLSIKRGRQRLLDRFTPGTITILYDNSSNDFPPFSPTVKAGTAIQVSFDDGVASPVRFFTGEVWQVTNDYPLGGRPITMITGRDALDKFTRGKEGNPTPAARPQELTGARLTAIKDAMALSGVTVSTNFDAGNETLTSSGIEQTTPDRINLYVRSELGKLFADRSGVIQFRQRNQTGATTVDATFSDDGVYLPFHDIGVSNGSDQIINYADWGQDETYDSTSIGLYGTNRFVIDRLQYPTFGARAQEIGEYLVNQYATPTPRIASIAIDIHTLSDADAATVCALDIDDQIRIIWTPPGTSQVDKAGVIESIEHQISVDRHRMTIGLTEPTGQSFTLDDPVYGVLDQNQLGL